MRQGKSAKLPAYTLRKQQTKNTIYKTKDPQTEAFLDLITRPKVGDKQNEDLIREITDEEIKKAISNLKPNKAAGPDVSLQNGTRR